MNGIPLPPKELRWGGPRYADDAVYIASALRGAKTLETECEVTAQSAVLDIGCGQGRLLRGLIEHFGSIRRYVGLDVHGPSIEWLRKNIHVAGADFLWVDYRNERYHKTGRNQLAVNLDEKFDCIALFSVFSHMRVADIAKYLDFIAASLAPNGKVLLSMFVEDDAPEETENPPGYHREWSGALHCVRINRQHFERMLRMHGMQIKLFRYRHTNDGQSTYVLQSAGQAFKATVIPSAPLPGPAPASQAP